MAETFIVKLQYCHASFWSVNIWPVHITAQSLQIKSSIHTSRHRQRALDNNSDRYKDASSTLETEEYPG